MADGAGVRAEVEAKSMAVADGAGVTAIVEAMVVAVFEVADGAGVTAEVETSVETGVEAGGAFLFLAFFSFVLSLYLTGSLICPEIISFVTTFPGFPFFLHIALQ